MFKGVYTALVTPFTENGEIDFPALDKLIEFQIAAGVNGLVLLGTTAETSALSFDEQKQILEFAIKEIDGRVDVIIGVGSNNTEKSYDAARHFLQYKPDGFLVVTPYYNKPNMSGLIEHYKKIAELKTPIILYHIPGRTGLKLSVNNLERLITEVPLIKAIKESDYDIQHITEAAVKLKGKVHLLCGNDDLFLQFLSLKATGLITAAGNVFAKHFVKMYKGEDAFDVFANIYPYLAACYLETNPTCVKYMLSRMGLCNAKVRLPLGPIADETKAKIDELLKDLTTK